MPVELTNDFLMANYDPSLIWVLNLLQKLNYFPTVQWFPNVWVAIHHGNWKLFKNSYCEPLLVSLLQAGSGLWSLFLDLLRLEEPCEALHAPSLAVAWSWQWRCCKSLLGSHFPVEVWELLLLYSSRNKAKIVRRKGVVPYCKQPITNRVGFNPMWLMSSHCPTLGSELVASCCSWDFYEA